MFKLSQFNGGRVPPMRILSRENRCYALMHLSLNTFTGKEWGYGDDDPALFNPTDFNADQIAEACRGGGLAGIIIVCKHHDGFCLWPTRTTPYNITSSPFRNGKGDLVREMADACRKAGLKVGFYVSPWDRNHPEYGRPAYLKVYQEQLREIYSGYGPAFEAWFDGANGGDGWYGGACEKRKIDPSAYYEWEKTWQIVRELQPDAAIFSDVGPDLRWAGNENGFAAPDAFGSYTPHPHDPGREPAPGYTVWQEGFEGHADGAFFIPPECDVPLRPGWFYHAEEDEEVRSLSTLVDLYLNSVGCGGFLNLGIAPDRRGRLHDNDVRRLAEFKRAVDALNSPALFSRTFSLTSRSEVTIEFGGAKRFNLLELSENMTEQGEAVRRYAVELRTEGVWRPLVSGKAIGLRRLKTFSEVAGEALRIALPDAEPEEVELTVSIRLVPAELLRKEPVSAPVRKNCRILEQGKTNGMTTEWRLGKNCGIGGFVFSPFEDVPNGTPDRYRFEVLSDSGWRTVAEGEFSNLRANPVPQRVVFAPVSASAVRLTALRMLDSGTELRFREFSLILK